MEAAAPTLPCTARSCAIVPSARARRTRTIAVSYGLGSRGLDVKDISDGVSSLVLDRGDRARSVVYELVSYLWQHLRVSKGKLGYKKMVCVPHAG